MRFTCCSLVLRSLSQRGFNVVVLLADHGNELPGFHGFPFGHQHFFQHAGPKGFQIKDGFVRFNFRQNVSRLDSIPLMLFPSHYHPFLHCVRELGHDDARNHRSLLLWQKNPLQDSVAKNV